MILPLLAIAAGVVLTVAAFSRPMRRWPVVPARGIISPYGASRAGGTRIHAGADLGAFAGDAIVAMDDGVVLHAVSGFGIGAGLQAIAIRHTFADVIYAEIRVDPNLIPGVFVRAGDRIGRADKNGDGNSMLHLEAWKRPAPRGFTEWTPTSKPAGLLDIRTFLPPPESNA